MWLWVVVLQQRTTYTETELGRKKRAEVEAFRLSERYQTSIDRLRDLIDNRRFRSDGERKEERPPGRWPTYTTPPWSY